MYVVNVSKMCVLNVIGPLKNFSPGHIGDTPEALWGRERGIRANFSTFKFFPRKKFQHKNLPKICHPDIKNAKMYTKI